MKNSGIEVSGFIRLFDGQSFKWDIQANFANIKNEITALAIDEKENVLYVCTKQKGVFKSGYVLCDVNDRVLLDVTANFKWKKFN